MVLVPIYPLPGISKSQSAYSAGKPGGFTRNQSAQGRYIDSDKVRFVAGYPEKLAGWVAVSGLDPIVGTPRFQRAWRAGTGDYRVCAGTETHLYQYDGSAWEDITPLRTLETGTLGVSPLTTANGDTVVAVADSAQTLQDGDWVLIQATAAVNGITVNGYYRVEGRSGTGYSIDTGVEASGSGSGGGTVTFGYPRTTLTNPFATTSGSATVTVTDVAHGATSGDYVSFSGASAVGGLTISGAYRLTVLDADTYTIDAGSNASSTASGGGSVSVIYYVTIGQLSTSATAPYGSGVYGLGPYGYLQITTSTSVAGWTLAPYGTQMLASPIGGTIYVYDPVSGGRAYPLLNAPTSVLAMFVTPERFVVALGTSNSPLTMAWADQNDYTNWTAAPDNTANQGRTKQGGSTFIGGAPVRDGVSLAFSDRSVFQMNYSGDNLVYDTPEVADNAGLIGPFAITVQGEAAYWMSDHDFWTWNGTVVALPTDDIREYVFSDLNLTYRSKAWAFLNRAKREVWFSYVSASSTEIDKYVIYHIDQQCWSVGHWDNLLGSDVRTCGQDTTLFAYPFMMDRGGVLYQHEFGTDDNGQALDSYVEFAPIDISNGTQNVDIFGFYQDFARLSGTANLTVNTRYYATDANTVSGPYPITASDTDPIDLREDGKMVGYKIESNEIGGDFRFGVPRLDVQGAGMRR